MININILYSKKAIPLRGSVNFRLPTIGTAIEDWQLQSGFTCVYTIFTWNFQISEKVIKRTERVLLYGSPSVSSSDTLITTRHFSVLITKSSASKQKFILTIDPWSLIRWSVHPWSCFSRKLRACWSMKCWQFIYQTRLYQN